MGWPRGDEEHEQRRAAALETLNNPNLSVVAAPIRAIRADEPARWIQSQMARFSDGPDHLERRAAVEQLLATIPVAPLLNHNRDETEARLAELADGWAAERRLDGGDAAYARWLESGGMTLDAMPYFARRRPVTSLLQFLLPDIDDVEPLVDDVRSLVGALAPGATPTVDDNQAARRLLGHLGDDAKGLAAISIVFQTHDATAALIGQALAIDEPACTARDRVTWAVLHGAPVTRTLRYRPTERRLASEVAEAIVVPLDSIGPLPLTFGSGVHGCPGRHLAVLLAEAVIGPFVDRNWHPLADAVVFEERANLSLPATLIGRLETSWP